ncbi:MAG TPA: TetR/AcrR family transcriptional regulator [Burkholderiales bacterium]|nr:TetR/AcrR family transcriptional regulator [Burkholderiales bacterium]
MVQVSNLSSNPSVGRLQRRGEARRSEILRAAARVFRRMGLGAAGMREIAEEADLSIGNLYYYFKGKDEILLYCQERTLEHMLAAVEAARAIPASCAERLRAVLRAHVHAMLDELEGATAHLEVEALPEELRAPVIEKRDRYEHAVRALVADGMRAGEFARVDAPLVTRAMLGAVNWTARWFRPDGPQTSAEVANALSDYLVKGLSK